MNKDFREKVRFYFEEFTSDELSKNFEQLVGKFNKENESPEPNPLSISLGTANFEQYKAEYQKHLNKEYADKNTVINLFKSKVDKLLEKRNEILNDIKAGKEPVILSDDVFKHYWYYTQKHWVLEIMEFERYLIEEENSNEPPQQPETVKPDEVKKELHNHIFKGNAFEVWQSMFDSFEITESSRTDLRFMFEVMKYNNEIQDTITVKNITDWINEFYDFSIDKLHYTSINSNSNNKRMNIYNLIKQGA